MDIPPFYRIPWTSGVPLGATRVCGLGLAQYFWGGEASQVWGSCLFCGRVYGFPGARPWVGWVLLPIRRPRFSDHGLASSLLLPDLVSLKVVCRLWAKSSGSLGWMTLAQDSCPASVQGSSSSPRAGLSPSPLVLTATDSALSFLFEVGC